MENDALIDDIVALLDQSIAKGTGHLNIKIETGKTEDIAKRVDTLGCLDCADGDLACNVPTLHDGMDNQPDKNP